MPGIVRLTFPDPFAIGLCPLAVCSKLFGNGPNLFD